MVRVIDGIPQCVDELVLIIEGYSWQVEVLVL